MSKFSKVFTSLCLVGLSIGLNGAFAGKALADGNSSSSTNMPVFRILTYSEIVSYGVAAQITPKFEQMCGCKVEWEQAKHQSIMLNQALLDYNKHKYDLIMGVNIEDATRVKDQFSKYFSKINYNVNSLVNFPFRKSWNNPYAVPQSSSPVTVLFNNQMVNLNPTQYYSWKDWINKNKASFIFGDPSSNDLGRALNRVIAYYYPTYAEQVAAWQKIKAHTVTIGKTWSTSYGVFTKGESQSALGYASSIIYHRLVENKYQYRDLIFKAGSPYLVDSTVIPKNSEHPKIAQMFASYLLTPIPQRALFIYNSSFPVINLDRVTINGKPVLTRQELEIADKISEFPVLDLRNLSKQRIESSLKAFNYVFTR